MNQKKRLFMVNVLGIIPMISIFLCCAKNETTPKEAQSEVMWQSSQSWNGDALPAYPTGKPMVSILKITIPPKTSLPIHKHPMMNAGVMIQGELHVVDDEGREITLKAGDVISECVGRFHYGENLMDKEVVLYMFYAGEEGMPLSIPKEK